ncbi:ATP-binding protein [Streptomyces venezuelae]|uniref:ATP-binding protein n=1 Tax=Streptomyces venezuelae TaxID=54571 RepID=A0A5P2CVV5_STRVZ|nr:ATP-binding protein [Streptomyces venezuelae]QES45888.1 ATP-binding protein [Streptomyces venezuelae]
MAADPRGGLDEGSLLGGVTLRPVPESVPRARREFRVFTASYNLACSIDDCVLMLSELVTNAVLHGRAEESWRVRVEWWRAGESLRVDVHNPGLPAGVRRRDPDADDAHGRGLLLVDALSDDWSAGPSRFGGTVVSFRFDAAWKP